jgi:uncharacterized protein (DUF2267 family)
VKGTVATGVVATMASVAWRPEARSAAWRVCRDSARQARRLRGAGVGAWYRLSGHRPDPNVSDDVLVQRVRSALGPIEKQLDLPRIHVMVEDGLVILHGEVAHPDDIWQLERGALHVSGVRSVASYLHAGLAKGSTRPSTGHLEASIKPSAARAALLAAARDAGVSEHDAPRVARAVLATFTERIPADERRQLLAHLPQDARQFAGPPRHHGKETARFRTVAEMASAVSSAESLTGEQADAVTRAVIARLRSLVPEEADDVAAVLPPGLRALWNADRPA